MELERGNWDGQAEASGRVSLVRRRRSDSSDDLEAHSLLASHPESDYYFNIADNR